LRGKKRDNEQTSGRAYEYKEPVSDLTKRYVPKGIVKRVFVMQIDISRRHNVTFGAYVADDQNMNKRK
jgi:hypothetical protein